MFLCEFLRNLIAYVPSATQMLHMRAEQKKGGVYFEM